MLRLVVAIVAVVLAAMACSGSTDGVARGTRPLANTPVPEESEGGLLTSTGASAAARVAAMEGADRLADYRVLEEIRDHVDDTGQLVRWVTIYRTDEASAQPPGPCRPGGSGLDDVCNVYDSEVLAELDEGLFNDAACVGDIDEPWCPTTRAEDSGDLIGVGLWTADDVARGRRPRLAEAHATVELELGD